MLLLLLLFKNTNFWKVLSFTLLTRTRIHSLLVLKARAKCCEVKDERKGEESRGKCNKTKGDTSTKKKGKKSVQRRKNVLSGKILLLQNEYERRVFVNIISNVVVDEMV